MVSATLLSLPQDILLGPQSKTFNANYGREGGCVDIREIFSFLLPRSQINLKERKEKELHRINESRFWRILGDSYRLEQIKDER